MERPAFLGSAFSSAFDDPAVVDAYRYRAPYPAALFPLIRGLIATAPCTALDVGCGRGEIARLLAPLVDRVDAVDPSKAMVAAGRREPGGDAPNLRWIVGRAEDAPLAPPYSLIVGGASLHWMEWRIVLPRFAAALAPGGLLALAGAETVAPAWEGALVALIARYTTNPEHHPYPMLAAWREAGLFTERGRHILDPVTFVQPIEEYIEALHSISYLARARMGADAAAAFDGAVRAMVAPQSDDGQVRLQIVGRLLWGEPHAIPPPLHGAAS
jgi:SAM-dependent methyltransferase